jgi:hypothetical protein
MAKRGIPFKPDYFTVILPNIEKISNMIKCGYSIKDIAASLHISDSTYYRWKSQYEELGLLHSSIDTQNIGKAKTSLINEVLGYWKTERHYEEVKDKEGNVTYSRTKKIDKWHRPSAPLIMFYLCNKLPEDFKRTDIEQMIKTIEVQMSKEVKSVYGE